MTDAEMNALLERMAEPRLARDNSHCLYGYTCRLAHDEAGKWYTFQSGLLQPKW